VAFDIYAGSFTRYYTRDWENVAQRDAHIKGIAYEIVYAGGDPGPAPSARDVRETVIAWRNGINTSLAAHGVKNIDWSEEDGGPYFTDRPGWNGYAGLLLWSAYAERPECTAPYKLPKDWSDDPVYRSVTAESQTPRYVTILRTTVWLPGEFDFCFKFPGLVEDEVMIGSCKSLLGQLRELEQEPQRWGKPSLLHRIRSGDSVATEEAAREGHRCFSALAERACEHGLPIVLSY